MCSFILKFIYVEILRYSCNPGLLPRTQKLPAPHQCVGHEMAHGLSYQSAWLRIKLEQERWVRDRFNHIAKFHTESRFGRICVRVCDVLESADGMLRILLEIHNFVCWTCRNKIWKKPFSMTVLHCHGSMSDSHMCRAQSVEMCRHRFKKLKYKLKNIETYQNLLKMVDICWNTIKDDEICWILLIPI